MRRKTFPPLSDRMNAWFLGPKSENADLLEKFIVDVLRDHIYWRRNFQPRDKVIISESDKRHAEYEQVVSDLKENLTQILANFKNDIPFNSPRYLAHMTSDPIIPAILGYFSAMLYNPNNVSTEGAPSTQKMEENVSKDLATLLGFETDKAWGHLTCGGTTANLEALWIARILKFFPVAVKNWMTETKLNLEIEIPTDNKKLINMNPDAGLELVIRLPRALRKYLGSRYPKLDSKQLDLEVWKQLRDCRGRFSGYSEVNGVVLAPTTRHYSVDKALDILGVGSKQIRNIEVDSRFRMKIEALKEQILNCQRKSEEIIAVIAVVGTTEEGAIDPVNEIIKIRDEVKKKDGISFFIHVDAAYGGYARSVLLDSKNNGQVSSLGKVRRFVHCALEISENQVRRKDVSWPEPEVYRSLVAIGKADSVTIDPHKCGYIPYPAGVVVFKNSGVRQLIRYDPPYFSYTPGIQVKQWLLEEGNETPLGSTILEGSKPGAAAAACWLTHKIIPRDQKGYGALLGETIRGAQELYERLRLASAGEFVIYPITRPDLNIVCFVVNPE